MEKRKSFSVVLVSGGMDSLVCAGIAVAESRRCAFLHANYGQRTEKKELESFHKIADFYNVKDRLVVDLNYLKHIGGSALTDTSIDVPPGELERKEIPPTYVPFRNAHFLTIATSWAEVLGADRIYIGAVEEDSSGYPDCRESFYRAFEGAIKEGTRPTTDIKIVTPLIHMKKAEIVKKGAELGVPFELSWSCYKEGEVACGSCDSCLLRLRGFLEAGIEDPIPYETRAIPQKTTGEEGT